MNGDGDLRDQTLYEIEVEGELGAHWAESFEGMALVNRGHNAVLRGVVPDQAALHGLLALVRDLGLTLVSVGRVGADHQCSESLRHRTDDHTEISVLRPSSPQ